MPWAKLDDRFPWHRKVRLLSDPAFRLYVSAICWCSENLTDGVIRKEELRLVSDVKGAPRRAQELVDHGLWEAENGGGFRIHDYLDYNPSAEKVRSDRKAKTARQKRWRDGLSDDEGDPNRGRVDAGVDASTDAPQDESRDDAPSRPDPYPSLVGTGGWVSDPQDAAAYDPLRESQLPSKDQVDHLPAEDPQPVVRTATIPGSSRGSADVASIEDRKLAKESHMNGCAACQTGRWSCAEGRTLTLAATGLWNAVTPDQKRRTGLL